jgi:hypothetical protein
VQSELGPSRSLKIGRTRKAEPAAERALIKVPLERAVGMPWRASPVDDLWAGWRGLNRDDPV